jgi:hypothetical protein
MGRQILVCVLARWTDLKPIEKSKTREVLCVPSQRTIVGMKGKHCSQEEMIFEIKQENWAFFQTLIPIEARKYQDRESKFSRLHSNWKKLKESKRSRTLNHVGVESCATVRNDSEGRRNEEGFRLRSINLITSTIERYQTPFNQKYRHVVAGFKDAFCYDFTREQWNSKFLTL